MNTNFNKQSLMDVSGELSSSLTEKQVDLGSRLYDHLPEEEKSGENVYYVIFHGIQLLGRTDLDVGEFQRAFRAIRRLDKGELTRAAACQTVAAEVLAGKKAEPSPLEGVKEREVNEARFVAHGSFFNVHKVTTVAGKTLPKTCALRVPKEPGNLAALKSEALFFDCLYNSSKLTPAEKAALPQKPVTVTYITKKYVLMTERQTGHMTRYYEGGDLWNCYKKLTLDQKLAIAYQLVYKMSILRKAGAVYTDIKMENVLVDTTKDPYEVHFSDFTGCYLTDNSMGPRPSMAHTFTLETTYLYDGVAIGNRARDVSNTGGKEAFEEALDHHMTRALGLMLCELFSEECIDTQVNGYEQRHLNGYYFPLKYQNKIPEPLIPVIDGMLGVLPLKDDKTVEMYKLQDPIPMAEAVTALKCCAPFDAV